MLRIHLLLLFFVSLTGCRFDLPFGDKTSPDYWADVFLDYYADDLVVGALERGPGVLEAPRTVLLITGVTIRARWFDPIVARLERDGFVPVVYEPPALLSGDLFEESEALAAVVERVRAESGQDKIDILAECTGGVIARHYIQSLGGDRHVSRMVTFVSPQQGVEAAPWAAELVGWPALHDLTPGSAFLRAVNEAPLPERVPFTSIYTCDDEFIQPYQTSIIPGATNIELCGDPKVKHFETFFDPEVYLIMHSALTAPLPEVEIVEEAEVEVGEEDEVEAEGEVGVEGAPAEGEPEAAADAPPRRPVDARPAVGEEAPEPGNGGGIAGEFAEGAPEETPEPMLPVESRDGGCSAGGDTAPPPLLGLALLALAVVPRRRCARAD